MALAIQVLVAATQRYNLRWLGHSFTNWESGKDIKGSPSYIMKSLPAHIIMLTKVSVAGSLLLKLSIFPKFVY